MPVQPMTMQTLEPADDSPALRSRDAHRDRLRADCTTMLELLKAAGDAMMACEITKQLKWTQIRPGQLVREFPNTFATWNEEKHGKRIPYIDLVPDLRNPRRTL